MATSDNGLSGMLDAAASTEVTPVETTTTTETPAAESTDTNLAVIDSSTEGAEVEGAEDGKGKETPTHKADGTERTPEEQEDYKARQENREPLPQEVRTALKGLRDADPKNASVVKTLHSAFERWNAAKQLLGTGEGAGIVGLKSLMQEHGAKSLPELRQAITGLQSMQDSVAGTDELLHKADPVLATNVYEDMKANGSEKNYGKVVQNFVEHLRTADPSAFYDEIAKPLTLAGLDEAEFSVALNSLHRALVAGDTETAKAITKSIAQFYTGLREEAGEKSKISKERQAWEAERTAKDTQSQKVERDKYENSVAEDCDKHNNTSLGKVLGGFLRMPFFKEFPYETKVDLGNGIKERLYTALKADKTYQTQMAAMWKQKATPENRAKMVQYHQAKLDSIATDIVTKTVQGRYPGYAKNGSAAGKAAAAVVKKETATKAATQSITSMKPIYIASRPEKLVRDSVRVGGKEYNADQLQILQIQGRGFVRTATGGLKYVTWRKQ